MCVPLERLGDFLSARGQPGDAEQALTSYNRSLEVRERLLAANPDSAALARDVFVSHYKLMTFHAAAEDAAAAARHLRASYDLLHPRISAGVTFDPPVMQFYELLQAEFGE